MIILSLLGVILILLAYINAEHQNAVLNDLLTDKLETIEALRQRNEELGEELYAAHCKMGDDR